MSTVTDGLVQITVEYSFNNTIASNVYYYWNGTNTAILDMSAILNAFDAKIFPSFSNILDADVTIDEITGRDVLGLVSDAVKTPSVTSGVIVGELTANFTCAQIRLNGANKLTRPGHKRIGGISEASVAGNGLTGSFITGVQTFANTLDDALTVGSETYTPVIYGGPTEVAPTRSVANTIVSTTVPNRQTTQSSRKR